MSFVCAQKVSERNVHVYHRIAIRFVEFVTGVYKTPELDSASNRNGYQKYFLGDKGGRGVELTTLLPSCVECLEIWEPQISGNIRACPDL
jgi:hypothetical protein